MEQKRQIATGADLPPASRTGPQEAIGAAVRPAGCPRCPALRRAEGAAEIIQAVPIGPGLPGVLVACCHCRRSASATHGTTGGHRCGCPPCWLPWMPFTFRRAEGAARCVQAVQFGPGLPGVPGFPLPRCPIRTQSGPKMARFKFVSGGFTHGKAVKRS
jgi:hypothetical protein